MGISEITERVESELTFLSQQKLNMSVEEVERKLRNMERPEYKEKVSEAYRKYFGKKEQSDRKYVAIIYR